ncbi:MAG: DUF2292 domain-containing protein [Aminipila sp.]
MPEKLTNQKVIPSQQEQKMLEIIHKIGFGEIKVIINDGKPIRLEEVKRSIKL